MISAYYRLEKILREFSPRLRKLSDAQAGIKPSPGKWSKKEILGHLIDSASNNHQEQKPFSSLLMIMLTIWNIILINFSIREIFNSYS